MGKITDIVTQKKRDTRASIFIDGKYCCGLEKITVLNERLNIGDEISPEQLAEIQLNSESATAFDKAIQYLSVRMRTEREICSYLLGKGYLPQVIQNVTDKLREYRYIDDAAFCRAYMDTYRARYGEIMLRQQLRKLGVDANTIEDAMEQLGDQTEVATASARKYLRMHARADRNKVYAFLRGKGFDYDTIKSVMSDINDEIPSGKTGDFD